MPTSEQYRDALTDIYHLAADYGLGHDESALLKQIHDLADKALGDGTPNEPTATPAPVKLTTEERLLVEDYRGTSDDNFPTFTHADVMNLIRILDRLTDFPPDDQNVTLEPAAVFAPAAFCHDCGKPLSGDYLFVETFLTRTPICGHCLSLRQIALPGYIESVAERVVRIEPYRTWITVEDYSDYIYSICESGAILRYQYLGEDNYIHTARVLAVQRQDEERLTLWLDFGGGWPILENRKTVHRSAKLIFMDTREVFPRWWQISQYGAEDFHFICDLSPVEYTLRAPVSVRVEKIRGEYQDKISWYSSGGTDDDAVSLAGCLECAASLGSNLTRTMNETLEGK